MKAEDVLKLYDNAIYLNDASEEEVKKLLKLGRLLVEQLEAVPEYRRDLYKHQGPSAEYVYIGQVLWDLNYTIENFKEIRI